MSLPANFTPIQQGTTAGKQSSFIGVLIHIAEPYPAQGGDWALEFTIQDNFGSGSVGDNSSLVCKIYRRDKDDLPKVGAVGDVVILRNVSVKKVGRGLLVARHSRDLGSSTSFFPAKSIPVPEFKHPYGFGGLSKLAFTATVGAPALSPAEQLAVINIKADTLPFLSQIKNYASQKTARQPTRQDKQAMIKDLTISSYHNIVAEVVKSFAADFSTLDIYVTDYTTNTTLFLYEDPDEAINPEVATSKNWQGPFGQMTMQVRLYEPHASWARDNIRDGDLVILLNVHTKLSQANKLEGAIHQDQRFANKVLVRKVENTQQIEEHSQRKAQYWNEFESRKKHLMLAKAKEPKKAEAKKEDAALNKEEQAREAARAKKHAKKERARLRKEQERQELEKKAAETTETNPHVRAANPEIEYSTVAEVLHNPALEYKDKNGKVTKLPFVNAKYRMRLRVVDYSPKNLVDFVRDAADRTWRPSGKMGGRDVSHLKNRWEWAFFLLVEDADAPAGAQTEKLPVMVSHKTGQHLLKINACNLRDHQGVVKKLEEKLFILWGNLMELEKELMPKGVKFPLPCGDSRLKNTPFDACVEEYGSQVRDPDNSMRWQRTHRLFATTIMD